MGSFGISVVCYSFWINVDNLFFKNVLKYDDLK